MAVSHGVHFCKIDSAADFSTFFFADYHSVAEEMGYDNGILNAKKRLTLQKYVLHKAEVELRAWAVRVYDKNGRIVDEKPEPLNERAYAGDVSITLESEDAPFELICVYFSAHYPSGEPKDELVPLKTVERIIRSLRQAP